MNLNTVAWVKIVGGYESADKRFAIHNDTIYSKHGTWIVIDRHTTDVCVPEYKRSCRKYTLRSAKAQADRWNRGLNV